MAFVLQSWRNQSDLANILKEDYFVRVCNSFLFIVCIKKWPHGSLLLSSPGLFILEKSKSYNEKNHQEVL